jgi:hypothetical protein
MSLLANVLPQHIATQYYDNLIKEMLLTYCLIEKNQRACK